MKYYIAGPMAGYPEFNFKEFFQAEKILSYSGYSQNQIYNPARADEERGLDVTGTTGDLAEIPDFDIKAVMKENCIAICECTHIYMLPGWEKSFGAIAEHSLAVCLGLKITYQQEK